MINLQGRFLGTLLGTLDASLSGNLLTKRRVIWAGEVAVRVDKDFWNFERQKYNQNEPKPNGVYSRNKLPKIKDVINLDEYKPIGTLWITSHVNAKLSCDAS